MKIGFCGTMSCGKSTLVHELSKLPEFKDYQFITEKSKELMGMGIKLNTDSTLLGQHQFMCYRLRELMQENVLTDRSIIDVMAFTLNAQSIKIEDKIEFEKYYSRFINEYDWIFYVSPMGVNIENNGIRTTDPLYRTQIDETIKDLCIEYQDKIKHFGIIHGSVEQRIEQVKSYLNF